MSPGGSWANCRTAPSGRAFRSFARKSGASKRCASSPGGPTHGREQARAFYENLFTDLSESEVESIRRLYGKDFLVDESMWRGRAPGRPFGLEGRDRLLEFRLLHVVEFAANGDIKRENVWLDLAAIIRQLPQN